MSKLKGIADVSVVTGSTVVCAMIHFLYAVLSRKYVDVAEYGLFSTCSILSTYIIYLQLGVLNAYNRDYTQLLGGNRISEARKLKNVVLTYLLCTYGIAIILGEIILYIVGTHIAMDSGLRVGFQLSAIIAFFTVLETYSISNARMHDKFIYSAIVLFAKTTISVIIGIILVKLYGYYALYIATPLAAIVCIIMLLKETFGGFKFTIDLHIVSTSIKTGLPLLINSLIWTVVTTIDQFIILYFMDTKALGYYSLAAMGFSTMVLIPQTISQVLYIRLGKDYGQYHDQNRLLSISDKYTKYTTLFSCISVVIAYYALPIFVQLVMPGYTEGITSAQIILIGVSVYASTLMYGNVFSLLRKNGLLIQNTLLLCLFTAVFSVFMVIVRGRAIENVAYGTAGAYILYTVMLVIRLKKNLNANVIGTIRASWIPLIITILPCLAISCIQISYFLRALLSVCIVIVLLCIVYRTEIANLMGELKQKNHYDCNPKS